MQSTSQVLAEGYQQQPYRDNVSAYSLSTVPECPSPSPTQRTALLSSSSSERNYGALHPSQPSNRRILVNATLKMAVIFFLSTAFLGATLWLALPRLEEDDRPHLKIPKSFAELQALNVLLKKYRDIYPYRIVICYVTTYFFLQAFSLPGSMYLSILGGAVWGVPRALPLACTCVATGATLCYAISAALGPAILVLPKFKSRLEVWSDKIQAQRDNLISFLIVLRIAPFPPHWVVNVVCPHVGIGVVPFWVSTWLGIFGVSVIHTTIGGSLDEMTSPADFHLISWRNFFLLSAVVVGAMIPVGLRYFFKNELASVANVEANAQDAERDENGDLILDQEPIVPPKSGPLIMYSDEEGGYSDGDSDEDVVLEAGPALIIKPDDGVSATAPTQERREWRAEDLL
ncbi:oxalate transporter [Trametopsis cervina]|nr:oxalate transporter [Trametopsis cervina]